MTVNTELAYKELAWTGAETTFAPGFPAMAREDVRVRYRNAAGGETPLTLDVHFSATVAPGSRIVTLAPIALPAAPGMLLIGRRTSGLQPVDFQDNSRYSQEIHEELADRAAMRDNEMREGLDRALEPIEGLPEAVAAAQAAAGVAVGAAETAAQAAAEAVEAAGSLGDVIRFTPQSLTPEQKTQARDNIGVTNEADAETRRSILLAHLRTAKLSTSRLAIFAGVADGFAGSDGINAGASTNYSYDAVNKRVTPGVSGTTVQSGQTASTAISANWTAIERTTAMVNGVVVHSLRVYSASAQAVTAGIWQRVSAGSYLKVAEVAFSHAGGGWQEAPLSTPYTVPASGTFHTGVHSPSALTGSASASVSMAYIGSPTSLGSTTTMTEGTGNTFMSGYSYNVTTQNMSLVTTTLTLDTAPTSIRVGILADLTETITSADLTAEATRTGAAWTLGTLTATKLTGNLWLYETVIDLSAQASGTSVAARIKTANGKSLRILGTSVERVA